MRLKQEDIERHGFTADVVLALGLASLPGVGPLSVRQVGDPDNIEVLLGDKDADALVMRLNSLGAKVSLDGCGVSTWDQLAGRIERDGLALAQQLSASGAYCITPSSPLYPDRLNDLGTRRPKWLFLKGNPNLLHAASAAVIGTREPSAIGEFLTKYTVAACRSLGVTVVSGLARGIDSIAHEWALTTSTPTLSVLGTGLFVHYPARNAGLANAIIEAGGLLISEYLPNQGPTADGFVWRNRLQAALSNCVVATEWKRSSGTAHTVRFANEMHRPSVSMELEGVTAAPDAGLGSRHLLLPTEHYELLELLSGHQDRTRATDASVSSEVDPAQESLF